MSNSQGTKYIMPQELEVWYVLPAIRRELSKALLDLELSRGKIASILGVSKASISHYIRRKRAKEVDFDKELIQKIRGSAERIATNEGLYMKEVQELCKFIRKSRRLCQIHRERESSTYATCTVCLE